MRLTFSLELNLERKPKDEEPEPAGAESMVIHQDQPRYIGFVPQDQIEEENSK